MRPISKKIRVLLFTIVGLIGVALLVALAVPLVVDINDHKPRIETVLSNALRMEVTVEGRVGFALFPGLHITLENARVRNRGTELAFIKEADLAIELWPLLRREFRYSHIATQGARINIERDREGHYNYERPPIPGISRPLDLPKVSFADLAVAFADKQTGGGFKSTACNGELTDMRHPGGAPFLKIVSLKGQFTCGEVHGKTKAATDLKFSVAATDGIFNFEPVTMQAYGGQGSGTMRIDRAGEVPTVDLNYKLSKFHIEQFFKPQASGTSVSGVIDFATNLSMRGRTRLLMRQSAKGDMSLSGNNLMLNGVDLDKELPKFASSQSFNLIDLGAVLLAGPVGLAATKGYEFSMLGGQTGGNTRVRNVVSQWKVEKGVAYAKDVALTTQENRLALQGGLDFVSNEYRDVVIALIDANGCAEVRQKFTGPFNKPAADKSQFLVPVGPFLKLLDKAKTLVAGPGKCEVFYNGTLAPPK